MTWTCQETRRHWAQDDELPNSALEHLAICPICQEIVELASVVEQGDRRGADTEGTAIADLLSGMQRDLQKERGMFAWLRSCSTPLRVAMSMCIVLVPAGAQLAFARRADLSEFPLPFLLIALAAYMMTAAFATKTLLAPLQQPKSVWSVRIAWMASLGLPLLFAVLSPDDGSQVAPQLDNTVSFLRQAISCLRYGALLAIPGVISLALLDRQLARGKRFLFVAACTGGIVGNLILLLHCANPNASHLLVGHATIAIALLIGVALVTVVRRLVSKLR